MVGCGPRGGAAPVERKDHDHFAETPQGKENLRSGTGMREEVVSGADLGSYGLKVFPGASSDGEPTAVQSKGEQTDSVRYAVFSDKPVAEVVKFYEKELGSTASILKNDEALVSGKIGDDFGAVVTIYSKTEGRTEIQVEVLRPKAKG